MAHQVTTPDTTDAPSGAVRADRAGRGSHLSDVESGQRPGYQVNGIHPHEPGHPEVSELSTGELVVRLTEQVTRLAREEARLAATELRGKARRAGLGAGVLGVAGVLAGLAGMTLVACLVLVLALWWAPWVAALVVGGALLLAAGMAALVGLRLVKRAAPPTPRQAMASVGEDLRAVRGATS
jgi:uncharacterized membrane protein YqjE